jgi:hypothetical protein
VRLILDEPYSYVGYHGASDGKCRVRVFTPAGNGDDIVRDAAFDPLDPRTYSENRGYTDPVIMVTDVPGNNGTSVTNMIEFIVAEVLARWINGRFGGFRCPTAYVVIAENAPDDGVRNHSDYARVTFSNGVPMRTMIHCGFALRSRWKVGTPTWTYLTEDDVVAMLGSDLERYPSLTHRHPIAEPRWAQEKYGSRSGIER